MKVEQALWKVWNEFCSRWEEERGLRSVLSEVSKITNATDTAFLALEEKESRQHSPSRPGAKYSVFSLFYLNILILFIEMSYTRNISFFYFFSPFFFLCKAHILLLDRASFISMCAGKQKSHFEGPYMGFNVLLLLSCERNKNKILSFPKQRTPS